MKFINYLKTISGVQIYPMMSLMLFVLVFGIVLVLTMKLNKSYLDKAKKLPLTNNDGSHEI